MDVNESSPTEDGVGLAGIHAAREGLVAPAAAFAAVPAIQPRPAQRAIVGVLRQHGLSIVLGLASIGGLFLFWYLGTKYRIDFYIRFKNVPTPIRGAATGIRHRVLD